MDKGTSLRLQIMKVKINGLIHELTTDAEAGNNGGFKKMRLYFASQLRRLEKEVEEEAERLEKIWGAVR